MCVFPIKLFSLNKKKKTSQLRKPLLAELRITARNSTIALRFTRNIQHSKTIDVEQYKRERYVCVFRFLIFIFIWFFETKNQKKKKSKTLFYCSRFNICQCNVYILYSAYRVHTNMFFFCFFLHSTFIFIVIAFVGKDDLGENMNQSLAIHGKH